MIAIFAIANIMIDRGQYHDQYIYDRLVSTKEDTILKRLEYL